MYQAGLGKVKVDYPLLKVSMMGYGMWNNRISGKETELHARSIIIEQAGVFLIFTNVEIAFITPGIRREVLSLLKKEHAYLLIDETKLMLTAQHTHSAPSGFSEYAYYSFTTPGFKVEIRDAYVNAIVESVVLAFKNKQEVTLEYKESNFGSEVNVAWNRSLTAFKSNPEIKGMKDVSSALALDRNMYLLQVNDLANRMLGTVNWFGVHATSIGNDNKKVSFDNKGYGAAFLEEEYPDSIHIFAQGKAGDISPHFHGFGESEKRKQIKRKGDHLYARANGEKQFVKAKEIIEGKPCFSIKGKLDGELSYSDYTKIEVDSQFTNGKIGMSTSDACFGLPFFQGTPVDGKGVSPPVIKLMKLLNTVLNIKRKTLISSQGSKEIIINAVTKEVFGQGKMNVLPSFVDQSIREMNEESKNGALKENTLIPVVLPIQIFLLGGVAIVGVPGEITTIAGGRIEKLIKETLISSGVRKVIISPYANSYMGYITTQEEYEVQEYEGGHTVFGQWTLAAFETKFKELCLEIKKPKEDRKINRDVLPPLFSKKELKLRTY